MEKGLPQDHGCVMYKDRIYSVNPLLPKTCKTLIGFTNVNPLLQKTSKMQMFFARSFVNKTSFTCFRTL